MFLFFLSIFDGNHLKIKVNIRLYLYGFFFVTNLNLLKFHAKQLDQTISLSHISSDVVGLGLIPQSNYKPINKNK